MNAWLLRMVLQGSCHSHRNRPRKAWKNGNKHIMDNIFINLNYPRKPTINNSYFTQELAHDTWWHLYKANDHFMKKAKKYLKQTWQSARGLKIELHQHKNYWLFWRDTFQFLIPFSAPTKYVDACIVTMQSMTWDWYHNIC